MIKMSKRSLLLTIVLVIGVRDAVCGGKVNGDEDDYPFRDPNLSWDERLDDLIKRLTLEEIVDQMSHGGGQNGFGGPGPAIPRLDIGAYQWDTQCLRGAVQAPGDATGFPQALGLAASFSTDLLFRVAEATGVEVRGKHNDFVKQGNYGWHTGASCSSPVINIMRDSRWGRNQETYGEDPYLTSMLTAAFVKGLQGNDLRYVRASAGCKHFDAYGGPDNNPVLRTSFDAVVSERDLRMTFMPAFQACLEVGAYSIMCSYNKVNGVPACANPELLTCFARNEMSLQGYVISDAGAIEDLISGHNYFNNSIDAAAGSVNAGCNLEKSNLNKPVFSYLVEAVKQGKVTEDTLRERVRPLFYTRMRLGEFDPPEMNPYSKLSNADVETPEHKALALEAAMKSFVLLKNNGVLPLNPTKYGIWGLVGPFVDNATQLLGDYAPNIPDGEIVTPLKGLEPVADVSIVAHGCEDGTLCAHYNAPSVQVAVADSDIIFVFLGTGQAVESEGNDRPNTDLPGQQRQLLQDVINNTDPSKPIILVLFNAGPINISFADQEPRVSAILECFFPAQVTGDALRHVLLNDVTGAVPAGRLPYTWPLLASQLPPMTDYSMQRRTYRYFDGEPLYPFGYGLSYTTFQYSDLKHPESIVGGFPLHGSFAVTNTGTLDADEE
ncbi:uncharacterized protein [Littorina saxatilis]|uniref:uncharacterized protein isoform X2 n=1 Tax=Littorina saxatilis TaxID=31220 RepID=UPI0038B4EF6C